MAAVSLRKNKHFFCSHNNIIVILNLINHEWGLCVLEEGDVRHYKNFDIVTSQSNITSYLDLTNQMLGIFVDAYGNDVEEYISEFESELKDPRYRWVFAYQNTDLVGFAAYGLGLTHGRRWFLGWLIVKTDARHQGIGSALTQTRIDLIKNQEHAIHGGRKAFKIDVDTSPVSVYLDNGFEIVGPWEKDKTTTSLLYTHQPE